MVMAFKNPFKKVKEEPEISREEQVKLDASEHRKSGEALLDELKLIRFPVLPERKARFTPETLENMQIIIENCKSILKNPLPSDKDTAEIDRYTIDMITQFKEALNDADEAAAWSACRFIGTAVKDLRADFEKITEESVAEEMKSRTERAKSMAVLTECRNKRRVFDRTIAALDDKTEKNTELYKKMRNTVEKEKKEHPEFEILIQQSKENGTKLNNKALEYSTRKLETYKIYKHIDNMKNIRTLKYQQLQALDAQIRNGEMLLLNVSTKLDASVIKAMDEIRSAFVSELEDSRRRLEELDESDKVFQATLDEFFSSEFWLDRITEADMKYDKIEKEEKMLREAAVEGKKRQLQEEKEKKLLEAGAKKLEKELEAMKKEIEEIEVSEENIAEHEERPQIIEI